MTKNSVLQNIIPFPTTPELRACKFALQIFFVVFAILFLNSKTSYGQSASYTGGVYGQGYRDVSYNPNAYGTTNSAGPMCNTSELEFNPFGGPDIFWETDNPVCVSYITTMAVLLSGFSYYTSWACVQPQMAAVQALSDASGVPLNPATIAEQGKAAAKCSALIAANNYAQAGLCCGGLATTVAQTAAFTTSLAIIYAVAKDAHNYARVCGTDWNTWQRDPEWTGKNNKYVLGKGPTSYQYQLEQEYKNGSLITAGTRAIENQKFREYIFGGREVPDNGEGACKNPNWGTTADPNSPDTQISNSKKILGYEGGNQRYYFRGPKLAPNFACERFLLNGSASDKAEAKKAFECCNKRSQEAICIESNNLLAGQKYDTQYCSLGQRCNVKGVWYDVYDSKVQPNYLCAKTYSVCPYNHLLGGGTETERNDDEGVMLNYCQHMKHCVKKPDKIYIRTSDLNGAFISSACYDFKGSSQNNFTYNFELLPINSRQFSAPMAQCFKETLENLFLHKAGNTKCLSPDEAPDKNNMCSSGYIYKEGQEAPGASFFSTLQNRFRDIIKLIMTIAITVIGLNVLLAGKQIERKDLMMFVIKLAVITYFALGNAWQSAFFNGVFNTGMVFADIVMRPDEGTLIRDKINLQEIGLLSTTGLTDSQKSQMAAIDAKLDGCQFPKFNYANSSDNRIKNFAYPNGKEYLRIWDMFDCKIASALGFGPAVSVPNIASMILGGFFTGGAGIVFFVGSFVFAFYLIALVIRALHIFLLSATSIILLVYVSPITITAALFKKTDSIYKKWQGQMIGLVFQPVILFAYLGILITIFNKTMIGDVTFSGDGRETPKQIICQGAAADTSIYCIFQIGEMKNFNGFEPLGVGIPMLTNMNAEKINTIIKAAFLMFIFTKILDQIPSIAASLVGGAKLASNSMGAGEMAKTGFEALQSIQSRALRGTRKHAPALAKRAAGAAKSIGRDIGDQGKKVDRPKSTSDDKKSPGDIALRDEDKKDD